MKRKLDSAINHCESIQAVLAEVSGIYKDTHPEIVEQYKTTYLFFEQAKQVLIGLRTTY